MRQTIIDYFVSHIIDKMRAVMHWPPNYIDDITVQPFYNDSTIGLKASCQHWILDTTEEFDFSIPYTKNNAKEAEDLAISVTDRLNMLFFNIDGRAPYMGVQEAIEIENTIREAWRLYQLENSDAEFNEWITQNYKI